MSATQTEWIVPACAIPRNKSTLKSEVTKFLKAEKVPYETWGTGKSKTLELLISGLLGGEIFWNFKEGVTVLEFYPSVIHVQCNRGGKWFELKQVRRIFPNGEVKVGRAFTGSVAEKAKVGESAWKAARRGLEEELGQTIPQIMTTELVIIPVREVLQGPQDSEYWPGLQDLYRRRIFTCRLPRELWRPMYVEEGEGIRSEFEWKRVESPEV